MQNPLFQPKNKTFYNNHDGVCGQNFITHSKKNSRFIFSSQEYCHLEREIRPLFCHVVPLVNDGYYSLLYIARE